jgi:hypothetical protein
MPRIAAKYSKSWSEGICRALQQKPLADVRFGSETDIEARQSDVRFTPETGFRSATSSLAAPVADGVNADQDEKFTVSRSRSPPMLSIDAALWPLQPQPRSFVYTQDREPSRHPVIKGELL